MRRAGAVKFPSSVQLFKLCQKVLMQQKGGKIHDQEVGSILNFNPSDCSHWKRGEKNVRSVFALEKLAETLHIEQSLIHDVASGVVGLDEAYFEYLESRAYQDAIQTAINSGSESMRDTRKRVESFATNLLNQCETTTPPLYLPEILRFFSFVTTQPMEMMDKLSRILRVRPGQYMIHFRRGDLKPQTRMSMTRDLARILFQGERGRFPELGPQNPQMSGFEELIFTAGLLVPKQMLMTEMAKLDTRRNMVNELATLFWVPKSLVGFQMQDVLRTGTRYEVTSTAAAEMPAGREMHLTP